MKNTEASIPHKLPDKVVSFLNDRLADEYAAHYLYNAAFNWCADKAYNKASAFFKEEAASELEHARGLQDYMVKWNVIPSIRKVETSHEFSNLADIIEQAYTIEYDLYKKYNDGSKQILVIDPSTFDFLGKYRAIQTDSVAEYSDFLNALQLIDRENKFEVLYFEQVYF